MPISFTCDFCSRKYRVDDGLAGRRVKCKECGTDLAIPSGAPVAAARAKPAAPQDLYGLDDGEDAPLPPPRRPGFAPSPSAPSGRKRQRSSSSAGGENRIRNFGWGMLIFGLVAFLLPKFGFVFAKGGNAWDPEVQTYVGMFAMGLGAVFLAIGYLTELDGSEGAGKLVYFGGFAALVISAIVAAVAGANRQNPPNFAANAPPNFPPPNFGPNAPPNFAPPNVPQPPAAPDPAAAVGVHITLSNGKAMPATSPFGHPMPGVEFHADYQMNGMQPPGVLKYKTIIKGPRASASDFFSMLHGQGEVGGSVTTFTQNDGPFEMYIEAEVITGRPGGPKAQRVSNVLSLPWTNPPPQEQPPGFGPRGFPNPGGMPGGNVPGRPGFGPPDIPGRPEFPRFGRPR